MMLKNTIYAQYVKERLGADIIEDSSGFIVYSIKDTECFIQEMCVRSVVRGQGYGKSLIQELELIAKNKGCTDITANVHLADKGATNTLMAAIKTGFEVVGANNNVLIILKKIGV